MVNLSRSTFLVLFIRGIQLLFCQFMNLVINTFNLIQNKPFPKFHKGPSQIFTINLFSHANYSHSILQYVMTMEPLL